MENLSWDWESLKYFQALKKQYEYLNENKNKSTFSYTYFISYLDVVGPTNYTAAMSSNSKTKKSN